MVPGAEGALFAQHQQAAELERRRREEEEIMTGYSPQDLNAGWQFKIVKGTFKTPEQIEAVIEEQAEFGWVLVEVFDQARIRFKRPASEASKDSAREGNPFNTVSKASRPGCAATAAILVVLLAGWCWLI